MIFQTAMIFRDPNHKSKSEWPIPTVVTANRFAFPDLRHRRLVVSVQPRVTQSFDPLALAKTRGWNNNRRSPSRGKGIVPALSILWSESSNLPSFSALARSTPGLSVCKY